MLACLLVAGGVRIISRLGGKRSDLSAVDSSKGPVGAQPFGTLAEDMAFWGVLTFWVALAEGIYRRFVVIATAKGVEVTFWTRVFYLTLALLITALLMAVLAGVGSGLLRTYRRLASGRER